MLGEQTKKEKKNVRLRDSCTLSNLYSCGEWLLCLGVVYVGV